MSAPPIERRLAATSITQDTPHAAHVAAVVDAAPPLSAEQRDRLAALLRGGGVR